MMNEPNDSPQPFADLIRQRRITLGLTQQQIADALRVEPEAVGFWERRKRRIELDRVPHLAAILQLDEQDVSRLALFEQHPLLHAALFGTEPPPPPRPQQQQLPVLYPAPPLAL
jgi:transcriptional regulator with XRE-family HTH domain